MNVIRNDLKNKEEVSPVMPGPVASIEEIEKMREELNKDPTPAMIPTMMSATPLKKKEKVEEKKEELKEYNIHAEAN